MPSRIPDHITSFTINMTDAAQQRPILAIEAARVFAKWANVEYTLAAMASVLIGDSAALAILDQIKAKNQQLDAIKIAAADKVQHVETHEYLKPLFKLVNKAAEFRNQLAHCMWGTIEQLPHALLLSEPKAIIKASRLLMKTGDTRKTLSEQEHKSSFEHSFDGHKNRALEVISLFRDNTTVWMHDDFNTPLVLLDKSIFCLTCYTTAVSAPPENEGARLARQQLRDALMSSEQYY